MLYDPKWEKQTVTKADRFSLIALIGWLEQQAADGPYCYHDTGHCLLGRYFLACGYKQVSVGGFTVTLDGRKFNIPFKFQDIPLARPRTFGAALKVAREFASS